MFIQFRHGCCCGSSSSCFLMRVSEGEIMWKTRPGKKSCYKESIKALEADVQNANALATTLPTDHGGDFVQLRLCYSPFAPLLVHLIEWLDCSCTDSIPSYLGLLHILVDKVYVDGMRTMSSQDRKASLKEFYAVIYPSLMLLRDDFQAIDGISELLEKGLKEELEDECTICMDGFNKIVLPNCGHSMCSNCFHDWNWRSQTCPFCRGNLEGIEVGDLWVLTGVRDVIDTMTLAKQNLRRFYRYIENLPLVMADNHLFIYDYLI